MSRGYIEQRGFGPYFLHRTGHSIGYEVHGNGVNIDNLETRDQRTIVPGVCFSIEPGIYLPEFGVRSEIDMYVGEGKRRGDGRHPARAAAAGLTGADGRPPVWPVFLGFAVVFVVLQTAGACRAGRVWAYATMPPGSGRQRPPGSARRSRLCVAAGPLGGGAPRRDRPGRVWHRSPRPLSPVPWRRRLRLSRWRRHRRPMSPWSS